MMKLLFVLLFFLMNNNLYLSNEKIETGLDLSYRKTSDYFSVYFLMNQFTCLQSIKIFKEIDKYKHQWENRYYIDLNHIHLKLVNEMGISKELKKIKPNNFFDERNFSYAVDYLHYGSETLLLMNIGLMFKECLYFKPINFCEKHKKSKYNYFDMCEDKNIDLFKEINNITVEEYQNMFIYKYTNGEFFRFVISAYDGRIIY